MALSRKSGVPFGDDIGSGALVDFAPFGLTDEPQVQRSVAAGATLVSAILLMLLPGLPA